MVIVFNPSTGAPIKGFNFEGNKVEFHNVGESKYYEPKMAEAMVATYPFLEIVTPQEAQVIKEEIEKADVGEFKCDKCDFSSNAKIALAGHKRSHSKEVELDSDIPVATVVKVGSKDKEKTTQIPDDLKGTDWYGDGPKETNAS